MNQNNKKKLGNWGEAVAAKFLMGKGYELIAHQYHSPEGEVDLLMFDPQQKVYVAIEVKTYQSTRFGSGAEAIDDRKLARISAAMEHFFYKKSMPIPDFRLEAVVVTPGTDQKTAQCQHLQDLS